jgi:sulfoxide reductase heme-binding subunit YedZ
MTQRNRFLKPAIFLLGLGPLVWLVWQAVYGTLGVNPIETINRFLGDWALRFLLIALAVTPLRKITGWAQIARLRRMLGLFAFFYVCLHLASYLGLDLFFDWQTLWKDVVKRRYITFGMAAFVLLVPLAATSTDAMLRRLGGRRCCTRRFWQSCWAIGSWMPSGGAGRRRHEAPPPKPLSVFLRRRWRCGRRFLLRRHALLRAGRRLGALFLLRLLSLLLPALVAGGQPDGKPEGRNGQNTVQHSNPPVWGQNAHCL